MRLYVHTAGFAANQEGRFQPEPDAHESVLINLMAMARSSSPVDIAAGIWTPSIVIEKSAESYLVALGGIPTGHTEFMTRESMLSLYVLDLKESEARALAVYFLDSVPVSLQEAIIRHITWRSDVGSFGWTPDTQALIADFDSIFHGDIVHAENSLSDVKGIENRDGTTARQAVSKALKTNRFSSGDGIKLLIGQEPPSDKLQAARMSADFILRISAQGEQVIDKKKGSCRPTQNQTYGTRSDPSLPPGSQPNLQGRSEKFPSQTESSSKSPGSSWAGLNAKSSTTWALLTIATMLLLVTYVVMRSRTPTNRVDVKKKDADASAVTQFSGSVTKPVSPTATSNVATDNKQAPDNEPQESP